MTPKIQNKPPFVNNALPSSVAGNIKKQKTIKIHMEKLTNQAKAAQEANEELKNKKIVMKAVPQNNFEFDHLPTK